MYSALHVTDLQALKRWIATSHLIHGIHVTFMDLKSLFRTRSRTYVLFATTLTCYQIKSTFCVTSWKISYSIFAFLSMTSKLSRYYMIAPFVSISIAHFSID